MSGPTRQRSLRERIQSASRGIGISWQGKKSKSYHSKESLTEAQSGETDPEGRDKEETQSGGGGADNRTKEPGSVDKPTAEQPLVTNLKDEGTPGGEKKALGRTLTQPQGTEQYKVEPSDTLAGIAARFDTTPSELAKLNRLAARIVFPGQLLFVPEKKNRNAEPQETEETTETLLLPQVGERERRPSVTDALRIPYRRASEKAHRFLKCKARHFTDGRGVVSGVLIITPNAVMFDPNVSDPLVIEHGVESYGVIAPLGMLMRAAIYFDIAHMKVQHAPPQQDTGPRPKADVYYGKMTEESSDQEICPCPPLDDTPSIKVASPSAPDESPPLNTETPLEAEEVVQEIEIQEMPKNKPEVVSTTQPLSEDEVLENLEHVSVPIARDSVDSLDAEVSNAFAPENQEGQENQANGNTASESRRERMLKRLSYPMESITSISRVLTSSPKSFVDFTGSLFSGRGSEEESVKEEIVKEEQDEELQQKEQPPEKEQQKEPKEPQYQNLVEEKPEIFETLDKLLSQKRSEEAEGQPLYLCLRMGIPKEGKKQQLPSPVLSYGKKRARSEYWFSIPRPRVDDLYNFLQQWIPQLYGDVDDVDPDEVGFIPIDDSAVDEDEEEDNKADGEDQEEGSEKEAPKSFLKLVEDTFGFKSISQSDWEVLSLGEMESIDYGTLELLPPDLQGETAIIESDHINSLFQLVPARAFGYPWTRIFSTDDDGFHLKTLYRKMTDFDCPVIIVIKDTKDAVFGALLSYPLRPSDSFYGTGESFLFTFHPSFKQFKWTGQNDYFVKGNLDSLSIGASEGHFGLWLDGDLYRGRSVCCQTYNNDPLASSDDFIVKSLEAWGLA